MLPSPSKNSSIFFFFFLVTTILPLFSSGNNPCSPKSSSSPQCPPFNSSPPPFPFSSSPGCGHPSFQLHCSKSTSLLTINNLTFSLLRFEPNTSSLTLSPHPPQSPTSKCSYYSQFYTIPHKPINLTNTPFRISDSSCSRLSLLKPCSSYTLLNCTHCPWHCELIKNPTRLFNGCGAPTRPGSEQGCQSDVLGFLDNFLRFGIQLEWDEQSGEDEYFSRCRDCMGKKNGVCGFKSSDPNKPFLCLVDGRVLHRKRIAALSAIFVVLCLFGFVGFGSLLARNRKTGQNHHLEDPATLFLEQNRSVSLLPPVFTYEELESSTNRFDPARKIGDGGFGSVYLGHLPDGRTVAVKYLHRQQVSSKSFCNEILILSSIDHPNLVKLHGYCSDPRGLLLVYDYIPNGTLSDHLHGPARFRAGPLSWPTRVDIALQVAGAMEYLHFSVRPAVVHRDITTANIFVDGEMRVRVGDFGLSRVLVCPDNPRVSGELCGPGELSGCVWTGPQGTPGYLDPDYHRSFRLTEKSDVYSFGVVLLELVTGMRAVDRRRTEVELADMAVARIQLGMLEQVVDPALGVVEGVGAVAELAFRCVAEDKDDRPDAREVVAELRRIWTRTRGVKGSNSVVPAAAES